MKPTGILLRQS